MKNTISKKTGFTLAEVLITLTMLGILSAMTISNLGTSIQTKSRLAEFRTGFSKMENAYKEMTNDEGRLFNCYKNPTNTEQTTFGLNINGSVSNATTECVVAFEKFAKAMGATRICNSNPIDEGCLPENYPNGTSGFENYESGNAYVLDNSMILFDDEGSGLYQFALDVNGRKGPNRWGQDIFPFSLKLTDVVTVNTNVYPKGAGILPADIMTSFSSKNNKTTLEMITLSAGLKE